MGLTYAHLDAFLRGGEVPPEVRARIVALREASAHKRAMPKVAPLPAASADTPPDGPADTRPAALPEED
jgi:NH3-dependent NAD+ synthetase